VGRSKWFNLLWLLPIGFLALIIGIAIAKELRAVPSVAAFIRKYPGTVLPANGKVGFPLWVGWQHFLNLFLMTFIIRSGVQIMTDHARLYWTRHSTPGKEWFRFQKEVPNDPLWTAKQDSVSPPGQIGLPGMRHSIGLARWCHLGIDTLWLANGLVFYVLIFTTGHWQRLVPMTWSSIPNASSVAIQYLSLEWPTDNGWVGYNSLQVFAYFITVFIAGPLAVITGLGMSPALSTRLRRVSSVLSIQTARSLHFLVMTWFLFFIVIHVALVFTTGLRENLDHVFGARNDDSWTGLWIFVAPMVIVIVGWVAATPFTLRHPRVVQQVGYALIARCSACSNTSTPSPASTPRKTSRRTSGTTANIQKPPSTTPSIRTTSPATGCRSVGWSTTRSSWTSFNCARYRSTRRSPSTSASRDGPV